MFSISNRPKKPAMKACRQSKCPSIRRINIKQNTPFETGKHPIRQQYTILPDKWDAIQSFEMAGIPDFRKIDRQFLIAYSFFPRMTPLSVKVLKEIFRKPNSSL